MDIQSKKIEFIKEILEIDSPELLTKIIHFIKKEKNLITNVNEVENGYNSIFNSKKTRKLNFIHDFINLENEETIKKLENLLWKNNDFWNELSLSQREEIEKADLEILNNETSDYETFMSSHRK
jgi:hypothetical protein